jgi:hypothetical protein
VPNSKNLTNFYSFIIYVYLQKSPAPLKPKGSVGGAVSKARHSALDAESPEK